MDIHHWPALMVFIMMDVFNRLLDQIFYGCIAPLFQELGKVLEMILITPFLSLHLPVGIHVMLLALLTASLAFWLRRLLKVEQKTNSFNEKFAAKRTKQQDLQMISEKYSREALYKATDDELNNDYNTFIAHHYARFVSIYLLPIFLILGWLNIVFSESFLLKKTGIAFVYGIPENRFGIEGLSVTGVFLLSYVVSLICGFLLKRYYAESDRTVEKAGGSLAESMALNNANP